MAMAMLQSAKAFCHIQYLGDLTANGKLLLYTYEAMKVA
jgi:hypothetical protein